jgi:hypothetical protein
MGQETKMAGGGKIQQSEPNRDIVATPVPYLQNTKPATIPAFMPGQREALAAQLSAGFGASTGSASPAAFAKYLDQVYSPAQTLTFMPAPLKPTTGGKKPVVKGRVTPIRRNTFGVNSR